MADTHYHRADLVDALRSIGLRPGDLVFSHSNIGFFGLATGTTGVEDTCDLILSALLEVIGEEGTLVVPTFTYSFPAGQEFDPDHTPSTCGAFTEYVRRLPGAMRSHHPCISVAAIGLHATELTTNVPPNGYGPDSFFDRFASMDGAFCNLNRPPHSTFLHYVERRLEVTYRFDKEFAGTLVIDDERRPATSIIWVRHLVDGTEADFRRFDDTARTEGYFRFAPVGRGEVGRITAKSTFDIVEKGLAEDPWFLTSSGLKPHEPPIPTGPTP